MPCACQLRNYMTWIFWRNEKNGLIKGHVNYFVQTFRLLNTLQSVAQGGLTIYLWVMHTPRPLGLRICNDVCIITYNFDSAEDEIWWLLYWSGLWHSVKRTQSTCTLILWMDFLFTYSASRCEGAVIGMGVPYLQPITRSHNPLRNSNYQCQPEVPAPCHSQKIVLW